MRGSGSASPREENRMTLTVYAIDGAARPGHDASTRTLQILTLHG